MIILTSLVKSIVGCFCVGILALAGVAQLKPKSSPNQPQIRTPQVAGWSQAWINEDVRWIITKEETAAFHRLANEEERHQFVEQFWDRRDSTSKTLENEYKDTHYERMLYAKQHFGIRAEAGWSTPRGQMYVIYGPPDEIAIKEGLPDVAATVAPVGAPCDNISRHGGSFEIWHYNNITGVNHRVTITFADVCENGELIPMVDKTDAEWIFRPPVPKYKLECNGTYDPNEPPQGPQLIVCGVQPPQVEFKDLEEVQAHKVHYNLVPFTVQTSFEKITSITSMLQLVVMVKNSDVTCKELGGSPQAPVQIFVRFSTPAGRIAQTVEGTLDGCANEGSTSCTFRKSIPMKIGLYHLDVVVKDVNGDKFGTYSSSVEASP